jgi:hypothetical protein
MKLETWVIIIIVVPLVLLDSGMKLLATLDLVKNFDKRPRNTNYIWLIAIWVVNMFGWLSYLLFGRMPKEKTEDAEDWG